MKRILQRLLTPILLLTALLPANAENIDDIHYDLSATSKTASVGSMSYRDGYSGDIVIPSSISYNGVTYTVTAIGANAFYKCSDLTSVTIPSSVTSIGDKAFQACSSLTSVSIPSSVTSIGYSAFAGCSGLTSVTIPESVTSIGSGAFSGCSGLTSVTIPESVTSIGSNAFYNCSSLTSVTIPESVTSSISELFQGCTSLTSFLVNNANTKYCSVDGVLFSKDKTEIVACPCGKKGKYSIPNSVTTIWPNAFRRCSGLTSVSIPESVTSIGSAAFFDCSGLTSVSIPESVTSIGSYAFYRCLDLTSVTIPESVTTIEEHTFKYCSSLTSVTIPESVTTIEEHTFEYCSSLTSVKIPASVTSIIGHPFAFCTNLSSITADAASTTYLSIDGVLFNKDKTEIVLFPPGYKGAYSIPSSVTQIGEYAFYSCEGLTSLTIPEETKSIGSYAFAYCSLASIDIPDKVNNIGAEAFRYCKGPICLLGKLQSYSAVFDGYSGTIYCNESEFGELQKNFSGKLYSLHTPYSIENLTTYYQGFSFTLYKNEYCPYKATLEYVKVGDTVLEPDENGLYMISKLAAGEYTITASSKFEDPGDTYKTYKEVSLKGVSLNYVSTKTQTSIEITPTFPEDISCSLGLHGVIFNGETYYLNKDNTSVKISGLTPNTKYPYTIFANYDGVGDISVSNSLYTAGVSPKINKIRTGATSFKCDFGYTIDDATVDDAYLTVGGLRFDNGPIVVTGLKPDTEYTATLTVSTKEGSSETATYKFTTQSLQLETLQPKPVSSTCAIVAASTNIKEDETSVGFQWKKYDAPASLKASEGYAAIYDGQIEGYIKNLQPTSYYNVRAFYKDAAGNYYYGDWVTFDPSDFSYFEPTVHTYPVQSVASNSARVRGYALAGTDEITEQGFQYWVSGMMAQTAMSVRAAAVPEEVSRTTADGVYTILASGQVMTADIDGLQPNTTYCYRAFVKTAAGVTYGEEQTFTTEPGQSAIYDIDTDRTEPEIVGYYDINGRSIPEPRRGITIVLYSDGSARKLLVK